MLLHEPSKDLIHGNKCKADGHIDERDAGSKRWFRMKAYVMLVVARIEFE